MSDSLKRILESPEQNCSYFIAIKHFSYQSPKTLECLKFDEDFLPLWKIETKHFGGIYATRSRVETGVRFLS